MGERWNQDSLLIPVHFPRVVDAASTAARDNWSIRWQTQDYHRPVSLPGRALTRRRPFAISRTVRDEHHVHTFIYEVWVGGIYAAGHQNTPNQMTLSTMSMPLPSAPWYLNVHIPSFFTSQKAPDAECMPRFPAAPALTVLALSEFSEGV